MSPRLRIAENLYLERSDLISHVHGMGLTRTGKSKLIELIVRDFITKGVPFCLIDPHGTLYEPILDWLVVMDFERPITLFDPSRGNVGFNPFKANYHDESQIMTKAERLLSATLMAWNVSDPGTVPRLTKMLTCIYYLMVEQQLPIQTFDVFLDYDRSRERNTILTQTKSDWVRRELGRLYAMSRTAYENYIESTGNRLRMFVHPQVRKILSINPLDLEEIIEEGGMLLVNLQAAPDNTIGKESNRVLGTLLVNEFWELTYKRQRPKEFFLVIDECHRYMTPDIASMLAEGAKYGLHLMLFHQDRSQVKSFEGAMKNAQTKIFFSTEESPLPQRTFMFRRADHTSVVAQALPVKSFIVPPWEREALIAKLAPPIAPQPEPVHLPPMDLSQVVYSTDPTELLKEFRYLTAAHLQALTGKTDQVVRKAMLKVKRDVEKLDGKNVYCYPERGKTHKHLKHELLITEFHLALYEARLLCRWEQSGLKDEHINPDAYFVANCPFFLEVENANPSYSTGLSEWIKKAKQYQEYADRRLHLARCPNFRVLFLVPTRTKAENLKSAIRQAGIPNLGRFWTAEHDAIRHITEPVFMSCKDDNPCTITVPAITGTIA